jgi:hypothetical protein
VTVVFYWDMILVVELDNSRPLISCIKVKHSHYRPMGPRGFWEVKASRLRDIGISMWLVVRLTHRPSLRPGVS